MRPCSRGRSAGQVLADAEQKTQPLLVRLDPESRAKVLMSLLALVLVGVALVAMVWLGARRLRRIARKPLGPSSPREDEWYRKRLDDTAAEAERNDH